MPRSLVVSNGSLFVALDERHRIRELTFPHVGLYNHLNGKPAKMGLWVDGRLTWTDDPAFRIEQRWAGQGVWRCTLEIPDRGIAIETREEVLSGLDAYVRRMELRSDTAAEVGLYFYHPLEIQESDVGDAAFFHPGLKGMVHFKGEQYFLFGGRTATDGLTQFAAGIKDFGDLEGSWRDAEDGKLSMNPIAQGSVDSTIGLTLHLAAGLPAIADFWCVCGSSIEELEVRVRELRDRLERVGWPSADALEGEAPGDLPMEVMRSADVLKSHLDIRGGLVAAVDSDIMETNRANYAYVWTRDGALAASAFDRLGDPEPARRFFRFCADLVLPHRPFFLQKYRPDGRFGATWHPWTRDGALEVPLQEDETALVLWAMAEHGRRFGEWGWVGDLWDRLVLPMANFLGEFRDPESGLPLPSYDPWEERWGMHAYTTATVVAGLRGAAEIAETLGKDEATRFAEEAESFRTALLSAFVNPDSQVIARSLMPLPEGGVRRDQTPDASLLFLILLGVLGDEEPHAAALVERIERELWVPGHVGGLARYSDDYYFRVSHEVPGNAWIITTLWLAQAHLLLDRGPKDIARARELLEWAEARMSPSGMLPEQVHPITGAPLSVAPLAWSHAEHVVTALAIRDQK